jgi:hypothetical protein
LNRAAVAEVLELLALSQSKALLQLPAWLLAQVVEANLQTDKPLSAEAQRRLADWILSNAKTAPGYLSALAFLNRDSLDFRQVREFFRLLASSPGITPNVCGSLAARWPSLREDVHQLSRDVQSVFESADELRGAGPSDQRDTQPAGNAEETGQTKVGIPTSQFCAGFSL